MNDLELGFSLGFRIKCLVAFGTYCLGFQVDGVWFMVYGLGCEV